MSEVECPWCGEKNASWDYLENGGVGKRYSGVVQLYCLSCGMQFEMKQNEFSGWWKVNEH